ncbi:helix-turn-helix domain-containing protein [Bacillus anthracis]|uniref:helix-turn-helix domain-containing protein n=1 Tax=Bacillus anthracis TaxID=1392 RepID=UPI003D252389
MTRVYDKTKAEGTFFRLPSELRHYTFMKGYKAEMNYLYGLIADAYNAEKKCAFPSQYTLSKYYGKDETTVRRHLAILEKVGLIKIIGNGKGKGNFYIPLMPLTQEKLFRKYPDAAAKYNKVTEDKERQRDRDLAKLSHENLLREHTKEQEAIESIQF